MYIDWCTLPLHTSTTVCTTRFDERTSVQQYNCCKEKCMYHGSWQQRCSSYNFAGIKKFVAFWRDVVTTLQFIFSFIFYISHLWDQSEQSRYFEALFDWLPILRPGWCQVAVECSTAEHVYRDCTFFSRLAHTHSANWITHCFHAKYIWTAWCYEKCH